MTATPADTANVRAAVGRAPARTVEQFTRAKPVDAPLSRNVVLTAPGAAKEVHQFGFDVSAHGVSYSVGDALGVYATNSDETVARWLAATALSTDDVIEVDGREMALRDALSTHYDICRVTPNLLDFVAEAGDGAGSLRVLRRSRSELDGWLRGRNGVDVVAEFGVRAEAAQWRDALVRLTPRSYSISSSPLVNPNEVQLTVSVVRCPGSDRIERGECARRSRPIGPPVRRSSFSRRRTSGRRRTERRR